MAEKQCHRHICRYNINGKCISEKEYEKCTDAVMQVLGKERYASFLEWEKQEIERKRGNGNDKSRSNQGTKRTV